MGGTLRIGLAAGTIFFSSVAGTRAAPVIDVITALEPAPGAEAGQLLVRARDATGTVNAARVDRTDGSGSFFESACRAASTARASQLPPLPAPFRTGATVEFTVPVPPGDDGRMRVTATSEPCSGTAPSESSSRDFLLDAIAAGGAGSATPPRADPLPAPLPGGLPVARTSAACSGVDVVPAGRYRRTVRKAVVCLINAQRVEHGLPKLRTNRRLARAAARHTADMRRRAYLAHSGPNGPDLAARLRKARYWPAIGGENIGAGTTSLSTPRATVEAWMESEGHRANILDRRFKEIGVAIEPMFPSPPSTPGGVYTANFGRRG